MQARVQKWGNSLALRIPKSLATQSGLERNSVVEMSVDNGAIVLVPVRATKPSLAQLLEGVTPENLHREIPSGSAVGHEEW